MQNNLPMFRLLIFIFAISFATANLDAQKLYSTAQQIEFAQTYSQQSKVIADNVGIQHELLKKYQISTDRYRSILTAKSQNKDINLTSPELAFWEEIMTLRANSDSKKREILISQLEEVSISLEDYDELLKRYKTDRAFAKNIQTYFKN